MTDKKIKVRIAVAVSGDGSWFAVGNDKSFDAEMVEFLKTNAPVPVTDFYFVEATLPGKVVKGSVSEAVA